MWCQRGWGNPQGHDGRTSIVAATRWTCRVISILLYTTGLGDHVKGRWRADRATSCRVGAVAKLVTDWLTWSCRHGLDQCIRRQNSLRGTSGTGRTRGRDRHHPPRPTGRADHSRELKRRRCRTTRGRDGLTRRSCELTDGSSEVTDRASQLTAYSSDAKAPRLGGSFTSPFRPSRGCPFRPHRSRCASGAR